MYNDQPAVYTVPGPTWGHMRRNVRCGHKPCSCDAAFCTAAACTLFSQHLSKCLGPPSAVRAWRKLLRTDRHARRRHAAGQCARAAGARVRPAKPLTCQSTQDSGTTASTCVRRHGKSGKALGMAPGTVYHGILRSLASKQSAGDGTCHRAPLHRRWCVARSWRWSRSPGARPRSRAPPASRYAGSAPRSASAAG